MSLFNYPLQGDKKPDLTVFEPLREIQERHGEPTWFDDGSGFQSKGFQWLLRELCNADLHVELMSPDEVRYVAATLRAWLRRRTLMGRDYGLHENEELLYSQQELEEVVCWFGVCADNGFAVGGSY